MIGSILIKSHTHTHTQTHYVHAAFPRPTLLGKHRDPLQLTSSFENMNENNKKNKHQVGVPRDGRVHGDLGEHNDTSIMHLVGVESNCYVG